MLSSDSSSKRSEQQGLTSRPPLASTEDAGPAASALTQPLSSNVANVDGLDAISSALSKYRLESSHFTTVLEELHAAIKKEREELDRSKEELEEERRKFQVEEQRVVQLLSSNDQGCPTGALTPILNDTHRRDLTLDPSRHKPDCSNYSRPIVYDQVVLNVGGARFTTSVCTLRNAPCPSLFSAMFSGRHCVSSDSPDGSLFIDRDGKHFSDILNFLRDGSLAYPPDGTDYKYLLELRAEADYYGLTGLTAIIDRYPYCITSIKRAATLNIEDSWMYEDGQDELVFTVDKACHLLGVGLCGTEGGLTCDLDVLQVDPDDFSIELARIGQAAQSFTKADGSLLKLSLSEPAHLVPGVTYMLSALIKGNESFCCEECLDTVIAGGVRVTFMAWESPNGTNEQRGQFPELYIRVI